MMARFDHWCPELETALAEPFPADVVEQKKAGRGTVPFVPWHVYVYRLNSLVGPQGWHQDDPIIHVVGGKLVMGVPITILGVRKINFGSEQEDHGNPETVDDGRGGTKEVVRDFGTADTNAFAKAFRRTCALFGMGLAGYDATGTARAMVDAEERRDMDLLIAYLRSVGPRVEPEALGEIGGHKVTVQERIRADWGVIRETPVLARAYAREVERLSGIAFAEYVAHLQASRRTSRRDPAAAGGGR